MMRFSNSASAEGASEEILAIFAKNFCQIDPKMMRFLNSPSADGASEENFGDLCDKFLPNRPENDALFKFRERRRRERRKFGNLCIEFLPSRPENDAVFISASAEGSREENFAIDATNFCQVDPKTIRFLIPRAPNSRAKKILRLMRRISAK